MRELATEHSINYETRIKKKEEKEKGIIITQLSCYQYIKTRGTLTILPSITSLSSQYLLLFSCW